MIALVIVEIKVHMNMCQIPHGYRDRAVLLCKSNYVRFSFVGDRRRAKFTKGTWTHQTNCSLEFWMLLPAQKNCEDQLRKKKHAIFAHELQSALRLTVEFSKFYFDP